MSLSLSLRKKERKKSVVNIKELIVEQLQAKRVVCSKSQTSVVQLAH
jgi:hypothetical protein